MLKEENYTRVHLTVPNTSGISSSELFFDPHMVVDMFLNNHPLLKAQFKFNGLWKPAAEEGFIQVIFHRVIKDWKALSKATLDAANQKQI